MTPREKLLAEILADGRDLPQHLIDFHFRPWLDGLPVCRVENERVATTPLAGQVTCEACKTWCCNTGTL